jgi:hypothetical protein
VLGATQVVTSTDKSNRFRIQLASGGKVRKAAWGTVGAVILAAILISGTQAASLSADYLAGRFPGAERREGGRTDWSYWRRGWLSRQAVYLSQAPRATVEAWYSARYRPDPNAGTHGAAGCSMFRTTRLWVRIAYAVSVTVCAVPAGTRIVVNESAFYSPPLRDSRDAPRPGEARPFSAIPTGTRRQLP